MNEFFQNLNVLAKHSTSLSWYNRSESWILWERKKKIAPHGCELLKLTVTIETTGGFKIPIFDTFSSTLLASYQVLYLNGTFQCIKVDRAVTFTLRLAEKKKYKGSFHQ